ncbi:MAG: DUF933 domain-containing protein [bacterium]
MELGIIGLPQTGKKTLFELLTHHKPSEAELSGNKPVKGVAEIKDPRFDALVALYNPKKITRARIDITLLPKIEREAISKGEVFKNILNVEAVCHVVRAFRDDTVYHESGSVDPKRDIDMVNSELLLNDMLFVEKRLERIEQNLKRSRDGVVIKEREVLLKIKQQLDNSVPIRLLQFTNEEKKIIASYPFITAKEMILVVNIADQNVNDKELIEGMRSKYRSLGIDAIAISAKLESEIAQLETHEEKQEYLKELGVKEPALDLLSRLCMKTLNLMSFFTVGSDEVKQWHIPIGSSAARAGGAIHSAIEKGFIRAEVMKYDDLIALGDEVKVKEAGKFYLKGKEYVVEDGDIMSMRFSG